MQGNPTKPERASFNIALFVLFFSALIACHLGLLHLPYFWDEAGYYVPAARDLLLDGSLIPHSTPSNAHPPLVLGYLALCWKLAAFTPVVTRIAMLAWAAFTLLGVYRLAKYAANSQVAIASTLCTVIYPVFFVQSSLAQVDLAAAGLLMWGLLAYLEDRLTAMAVWFSLAALAKETAVLVPAALFAWEFLRRFLPRFAMTSHRLRRLCFLCAPVVALSAWYAYHYTKMGFVFGNPEFFRYNVRATMHPLRMLLAMIMRLWQIFGYMGLWTLSVAAAVAMGWPALKDGDVERPRIDFAVQLVFLAIIIVYVVAMAIVGGAELARYMLPVIPLVIIVWISTLWRRVRLWVPVVLLVALGFVMSLFANPPYGFSLEDNLAYRDYILLHEDAARFLAAYYAHGNVLTAWPGNDELTRPYLGYVEQPIRVVRIEDFTVEQVVSAADSGAPFDVAFVFSTKYQPPRPMLEHWRWWQETKIRFFDYHRDLPPALAARVLNGDIVFEEHRNGQWAAVIAIQQWHDARLIRPNHP